MNKYTEFLNKYKELNKTSKSREVVFFGTDWLYEIPVSELAVDSGIERSVYNRSLKGLQIKDSEQVIGVCVCDLQPDKVFINIGENDINNKEFDINAFLEKYEWLLYTIYAKCRCEIYVLSVVNDETGTVNEELKKLSEKYGCEYIDIQFCKTYFQSFFSKVRFFLRNRPISFTEAMCV